MYEMPDKPSDLRKPAHSSRDTYNIHPAAPPRSHQSFIIKWSHLIYPAIRFIRLAASRIIMTAEYPLELSAHTVLCLFRQSYLGFHPSSYAPRSLHIHIKSSIDKDRLSVQIEPSVTILPFHRPTDGTDTKGCTNLIRSTLTTLYHTGQFIQIRILRTP